MKCPECKKEISLKDVLADGTLTEFDDDGRRTFLFCKELYVRDIHANELGFSAVIKEKLKKRFPEEDLIIKFLPLAEEFKRMPLEPNQKIKIILIWKED